MGCKVKDRVKGGKTSGSRRSKGKGKGKDKGKGKTAGHSPYSFCSFYSSGSDPGHTPGYGTAGCGGSGRRPTTADFPNLGMKVEWVDGKVIVTRNGKTEVYNSFSELRVPSRRVQRQSADSPTKPNAVYIEHNGVRYYIFTQAGVTVKSCLSYWPETDTQPPEHLFGAASASEVSKAIEARITAGPLSPRAEKAYVEYRERRWQRDVQRAVERARKIVRDQRWRRQTRRAVEKAVKIVARQNGYELLPPNLPVSQGLIEELRERGFEVRVKA